MSGQGPSGGGGGGADLAASPAAAAALQEQLRKFWADQKDGIAKAGTELAEFKNQPLPLARIKKIMKADEDVRMIAAEAPVLFAKACELFVLELTSRAWAAAEEARRRTLQRSDVAVAVHRTEVLDFLADTVPREEAEAAVAAAGGGGGAGGAPGSGLAPQ